MNIENKTITIEYEIFHSYGIVGKATCKEYPDIIAYSHNKEDHIERFVDASMKLCNMVGMFLKSAEKYGDK